MASQHDSSRSSFGENSISENYQPRSRRERRELEELLESEPQELYDSQEYEQELGETEYADYEDANYDDAAYDPTDEEFLNYEDEAVEYQDASYEDEDYAQEYSDEGEYEEYAEDDADIAQEPDDRGDENSEDAQQLAAASSAAVASRGKKRKKKEKKQPLTLKQAQAQGRVREWAWTQVRETGAIILYALIIAFIIKTFLIRGFYIPSGSMENTLQVNDRVFINVAGSYFNDPKRGDVVVFKDSQGWIPSAQKNSNLISDGLTFVGILPDTSSNYLVKRVIGLPGDTVEGDGSGKIKVNGVEINEPYLHPGSNPSDIPFKVTVPDGKYFMMGDHRDNSADSRFHIADSRAFVPREDIAGTVFVIAWPLNHFGFLDDEKKVFDSVPNP